MRVQRPTLLVALMLVMIGARLCLPLTSSDPVVKAAPRRPATQAPPPAAAAAAAAQDQGALHQEASVDGIEPLGNPFGTRAPPPAPLPPASTPPPPPAPVAVAAPAPLADPAPPFQVIGTWSDGTQPGVFVATPTGVELAQVGSRLGAEYKVSTLTKTTLDLEHVSSKRHVVLAVPAGTAP